MTVRFLIVCGGSGIALLGQRQVLGVDAELQIDASKENVVKQWSSQDLRSFYLELDQNVGTTGLLFKESLGRVCEGTPLLPEDKGVSEYVRRGIYDEQDIRHVQFLARHSAATIALERGLAQSPAVGGLTIRHPVNREALEQVLKRMTAGMGLGSANHLEAWIVSSTAGGTGEGTHRFVAAYLADFMHRNHIDTPLTLNFVRVGQLTYRTVNMERTALNTFFGVAADAAFVLKTKKEHPELPNQWFYVDVPDVGTGARSIQTRARIVEMAAKAVMLEELQNDLQNLLVNNSGIPMVLTRTGYWGKDFGAQRKYYETLRQLREKLRQLVEPDYERKYVGGTDRLEPRFEAEKELEEWQEQAGDASLVLRRWKEEDWEFPRYQLKGYPTKLEEVREWVVKWKAAMEKLLGESFEGLRADWLIERVREEKRESIPLRISATGDVQFGQAEWFHRVDEAHEARAWSWRLLGCNLQDGTPRRGGRGNRLEALLNSAQEISKALHAVNPLESTTNRARKAAGELHNFLRTLIEVDFLLRLEQEARRMLSAELSVPRRVLEMAESEFQTISRAVERSTTEVVRAAELSDPLNPATRETWLQLLAEAARRGDRSLFERRVLQGATGLTEAGLVDVLGLRPQAGLDEIHEELARHMGQMYDPDGKVYEAPLWAATRPTPSKEYEYRILPSLEVSLRKSLETYQEQRDSKFRYIFVGMGTIGLYVLAFNGISLTRREGDTRSLPAFLMHPFVPVVRTALRQWVETPKRDEPSGQLRIVTAGVGGEPLYAEAMREAGLTEEEINKIGQFYKLYLSD